MRFAAIALIVLPLVLAAPTPGAGETASEPKTIASYCSASGDVCYGIFSRSGKVYLEITTAARYFKRYTLCVRRLPPRSTPKYAQRCGLVPRHSSERLDLGVARELRASIPIDLRRYVSRHVEARRQPARSGAPVPASSLLARLRGRRSRSCAR